MIFFIVSADCPLVMSQVLEDLGQHWIRLWLGTIKYQVRARSNVDLSWTKSTGKYFNAFSIAMHCNYNSVLRNNIFKMLVTFPKGQWVHFSSAVWGNSRVSLPADNFMLYVVTQCFERFIEFLTCSKRNSSKRSWFSGILQVTAACV